MAKKVVHQQQLFLVYVRNGGTCAVCGRAVNPDEMATDRAVTGLPRRGELRRVRLVHPGCRPMARRRIGYPEAA
jgi:hypothetical protein